MVWETTLNWEHFFKENEKKAFVIAFNYLRNKDDAFDVVQDTMFAIYNKYSNISDPLEAKALFFKILNNKLTDKYRSLKRLWNKFTESEANLEELILIEDHSDFLEMQLIEKSFKELTSIQQRVFLLKTIEEFTFKEISEMLSISESTCKTHFSRAIKKIKKDVN